MQRPEHCIQQVYVHFYTSLTKQPFYNNQDSALNEEDSVSNIIHQVALLLFIWFVIAVLPLQQSLLQSSVFMSDKVDVLL